ncbi:hypothetical protein JCM8097_002172 [Rhodosporidiobolus ruineniae]
MPFLPFFTDVRLENGVISAKINGKSSWVFLDTYIGNLDGKFVFNGVNVMRSSRNLSLSAHGILTGELKSEDGRSWPSSSIDLSSRLWDSTGVLEWGHGNFLPFSTNVRLENGFICADVKGVPSQLHLDPFIGNRNGRFECGGVNVTRSARDLRLCGSILNGQLESAAGHNWIDASFDLSSDITDMTGALQWSHGAGKPFLPKSSNVRLDNGILLADIDGKTSQLPLDGALGNVDGQFVFGFKNVTQSARNLSLANGGVLTGQLKNEGGDWVDAAIHLGDDISDSAGILKFEGVPVIFTVPKEAEEALLLELSKALARMPETKIEMAVDAEGGHIFNINWGEDSKIGTEGVHFGSADASIGVTDDKIGGNTVFRTFGAQSTMAVCRIIQEADTPLEEVNIDIWAANMSAGVTVLKVGDMVFPTHAGWEVAANLVKLQASVFEAQVGVALDTGIGIKDGSWTTEVLGTGFSFGRRTSVSFFGTGFGVDLGRLF